MYHCKIKLIYIYSEVGHHNLEKFRSFSALTFVPLQSDGVRSDLCKGRAFLTHS